MPNIIASIMLPEVNPQTAIPPPVNIDKISELRTPSPPLYSVNSSREIWPPSSG